MRSCSSNGRSMYKNEVEDIANVWELKQLKERKKKRKGRQFLYFSTMWQCNVAQRGMLSPNFGKITPQFFVHPSTCLSVYLSM